MSCASLRWDDIIEIQAREWISPRLLLHLGIPDYFRVRSPFCSIWLEDTYSKKL